MEVAAEPSESAPHSLDPVQIELEIVYEDADLLVVNKPRGLATHPAASLREPSLVNALLSQHALSSGSAPFRPGIVHRLDKETTGLLVVAKNDAAHASLTKQIANKTAERRYAALVVGEIDQSFFKIDAPVARDRTNRLRMAVDPQGKNAITWIRQIATVREGTVVAARLETGRTHQIRIHLKAIGHPVLGDRLYNPQRSELPLQLHAGYLAFDHPVNGERVTAYVSPPEDFVARDHVTRKDLEAGF